MLARSITFVQGVLVVAFIAGAGCGGSDENGASGGTDGGAGTSGTDAGVGGSGGGGECQSAGDCGTLANECSHWKCEQGLCKLENAPAATPLSAQTVGDCKLDQCDGKGQIVSVPDDTDPPNDANECTQNVCSSGVGSNPPEPAGKPCGGASTICDGAGSCVECVTPNDCPGTDSECRVRTCESGVCGVSNAAKGTAVASQTAGDCKKNQCDGAGTTEVVSDDLNVPDDGNECTNDSCDAGGEAHEPKPLNTPCGAGGALYCDDSGSCLGCTDASQCTAPSNQCLTATCLSGACGSTAVADGTSCDDSNLCSQVDTCQAGACTGSNAVVCSASDQCHAAGTCSPATGSCSNPSKPNGTTCNDSDLCTQTDSCQAGACVGSNPVVCSASDQCHAAGTCSPATGSCSNPSKPNGTTCNDSDLCTQTDSCQAGACVGSNPVVCSASDQCHAAGTCSPATGSCSNPSKPNGTTCNDSDLCTQTDSCQAGACVGSNPVVCSASDQCHAAGTCSPATGSCSNPSKPNGASCDAGVACLGGACSSGTCVGTALPGFCYIAGICYSNGSANPQNQCQACVSSTSPSTWSSKPNFTQCDVTCAITGESCQSGFCTASIVNPGKCLIAGTCYNDGDLNPANECERCLALLVQTAWSNDDSLTCNSGTQCCSAGVCGGC